MTASIFAAENGARVTLIERNEKLGKKLYITGKGRCNLTNMADMESYQANIIHGGRFLRSSLSTFDAQAVRAWFDSLGLPTIEERGGRVFPASGKASDVTKTLTRSMSNCNVNILLNSRVTFIDITDRRTYGITLEDGGHTDCHAIILATGGMSYPATGSTGDGYRLARLIGHTIVAPRPALTPLLSDAEWARSLQGLSLRNVTLEVKHDGKCIMNEMGEMLFTHFGISGPLALTLSSRIPDEPFAFKRLTVTIDLKPALTIEQIDFRLQREFSENSRKQLNTVLCSMLPSRLAGLFPNLCGIDPKRMPCTISRAERAEISQRMKSLPMPITGLAGFEDAVITRGGVNLNEINPKTMESKLVGGLYFAGEIIDADALTGGFNLQIAIATGAKAGKAAANMHLSALGLGE